MSLDYIPRGMRKKGKTVGAVTKNKKLLPAAGTGKVQKRGISTGGMGSLGKPGTMARDTKLPNRKPKMLGKKIQKWMPPMKLKRY